LLKPPEIPDVLPVDRNAVVKEILALSKSIMIIIKKGELAMSIVLIGGHDRMHNEYREICTGCGHNIKVYTQMPRKFESRIGNPDGMVIFTSTVSHKMVTIAVKEAKRRKIPVVRNHNSSAFSLKSSIQELEEKSLNTV
jgi:hypothetical protein